MAGTSAQKANGVALPTVPPDNQTIELPLDGGDSYGATALGLSPPFLLLDTVDRQGQRRVAGEGELQSLREQVYDHEGRIARLETWRDNLHARHSQTPVWVFGVFGAITALVSTLVSLYTAGLI